MEPKILKCLDADGFYISRDTNEPYDKLSTIARACQEDDGQFLYIYYHEGRRIVFIIRDNGYDCDEYWPTNYDCYIEPPRYWFYFEFIEKEDDDENKFNYDYFSENGITDEFITFLKLSEE